MVIILAQVNVNVNLADPLMAPQSALAINPQRVVFTISELASEFDITTRAIRFYETKGLLTPERQGQKRIYNRSDRTRLKLVLRGKRLGFALDDIRRMIELYDEPDGEAKQLALMLDQLESNRQLLLQKREDLELQLKEFDDIETRCRMRLLQLRK